MGKIEVEAKIYWLLIPTGQAPEIINPIIPMVRPMAPLCKTTH